MQNNVNQTNVKHRTSVDHNNKNKIDLNSSNMKKSTITNRKRQKQSSSSTSDVPQLQLGSAAVPFSSDDICFSLQ